MNSGVEPAPSLFHCHCSDRHYLAGLVMKEAMKYIDYKEKNIRRKVRFFMFLLSSDF